MATQTLPKKVQASSTQAIQPSMANGPGQAEIMHRLRQEIQQSCWPLVNPLAIAAANWGDGKNNQVTICNKKDCFEVQAKTPGLGVESLEVLANHHYMSIRSLSPQVGTMPPFKAGLKLPMQGPDSAHAMEGSALHAMIPLPEGTDREKIEAIYMDGLLMVRIPKKRLGAGRKIPLKPA